MRSVLVALDDTPAGAGAAKLALSLAARHGAAVTGVGVLDVGYLTAPEPGGVGTAYYKFKADLARLKQAHERTEQLVETFLQQCKAQNVKGDVLAVEGSPVEEVRTAAAAHDLIVIGRDSNFHGEPTDGLAGTVERILQGSPRPLIITPNAVQDPSRIVIAYDGSIPAARALQIFTLLGLAANSEVHVISVSSTQEAADHCLRRASAYLGLYGSACVPRAIASRADPAELIIAEVRSLGAGLLMMGAYGHRGWREALLGSATTRLLSECPTALFIHH